MRLHPEVGMYRLRQPDEPLRFILNLVFTAEYVRVVLSKSAHPHEAMKAARRLVAVAGAELSHA